MGDFSKFKDTFVKVMRLSTQLIVYHYLKEDEFEEVKVERVKQGEEEEKRKDGKEWMKYGQPQMVRVRRVVPVSELEKVYIGGKFPKVVKDDKFVVIVTVYARYSIADLADEVPVERWVFTLEKGTKTHNVVMNSTADMIFRGIRERLEFMPLNDFLEVRSSPLVNGKQQRQQKAKTVVLRCDIRTLLGNNQDCGKLTPIPYGEECKVAEVEFSGGKFTVNVTFCNREFVCVEDFNCILPVIFRPPSSDKTSVSAIKPDRFKDMSHRMVNKQLLEKKPVKKSAAAGTPPAAQAAADTAGSAPSPAVVPAEDDDDEDMLVTYFNKPLPKEETIKEMDQYEWFAIISSYDPQG